MPNKSEIESALSVAKENLLAGEQILTVGRTIHPPARYVGSIAFRVVSIYFLSLCVLGFLAVNFVAPDFVAPAFAFILLFGTVLILPFFFSPVSDRMIHWLFAPQAEAIFITNRRLLVIRLEDLTLTVLAKKTEIAKIRARRGEIEVVMENGARKKLKVFDGLS